MQAHSNLTQFRCFCLLINMNVYSTGRIVVRRVIKTEKNVKHYGPHCILYIIMHLYIITILLSKVHAFTLHGRLYQINSIHTCIIYWYVLGNCNGYDFMRNLRTSSGMFGDIAVTVIRK